MTVSILPRVHEPLMLDVAVPDAGERLDVPHFGWADVHLAVLDPDGSVVSEWRLRLFNRCRRNRGEGPGHLGKFGYGSILRSDLIRDGLCS